MSAKQRDSGSKIEQYAAKPAAYEQLYSDGGGDAATKAATRERKSNDMIDRNLQRAMRNGTPQQRVAAGVAYQERSSRAGYQQGGGINSAGSNQERDQKTGEKFTAEGLRLEGKENPADVVAGQADAANKPASASMGDGSGRDAANARGSIAEGSTGGEWTNVGSSATENATTPSAREGEAGNGTLEEAVDIEGLNYRDVKSALAKTKRYIKEGHNSQDFRDFEEKETAQLEAIRKKDPMAARAFDKIDGHIDSANDQKAKFANDLKTWGATDPKDRKQTPDQILEYGAKLGLDENQINAAIRGDKELDRGSAALSAQAEAKSRADKTSTTPKSTGSSVVSNISEKYAGQGLQDGDVELARGLQTMSPDAQAKSNEEAEKIKGYKEKSDSYFKDKSDSELARDRFEAKMMIQESKNLQDSKDATKAVEIINAGRQSNFEDIKKNSKDRVGPGATSNPLTWFDPLLHDLGRMVSPERKDAKSPEMDWDAFDKRDPNDPNFGQRVYQSQYDKDGNFTTNTGQSPREIPAREPSTTKEVVSETGSASPEKQINSPSSIGGKYSGKEYNTSGVFGESRVGEEHFLKTMFKGANTPPAKVNGSGFPSKEKRTPTQASNDMKLQQREAAYQAPINDVLERSSFLQRYAV